MESPSLEVLKKSGGVALSDTVSGYGGDGLMVGLDSLRGLSNLFYDSISFDKSKVRNLLRGDSLSRMSCGF